MFAALAWLIGVVTSIIIFVVLAQVVMTWLYHFNVLNRHNSGIYQVYGYLNQVVEPMCRPLRRRLPQLGGIDISPMVLLLIVGFVRVLALNLLT